MRFHQEITMGRMLTLFGAQWVKEKKRHSTMLFFSTGVWDGCPNPQPKYLFLI